MIDYFINKRRTSLTDLWLAILGGGEPFLSPELTREIIIFARKRAEEQGFNLGIGLTTNGSLYNEDLALAMVKNNVSLGVSFEVLEEIQNSQRQHYNKVVAVVTKYMNQGVDITIKSIITPMNVNRLNEMVTEMHRLFPDVKKYKLQIVEDPILFTQSEKMKEFYENFTRNFFQAENTGRKLGIDVYVLASKYVDMLIEHYCGGEMCLNPEGTITICHRKSSPQESGYEDFVYGRVDDNGNIKFDTERFKHLIAHNINARKACSQCFAKWHCGGGCLAQATIYNQEQLDIICEWTRNFTKEILTRRLCNASEEEKFNHLFDMQLFEYSYDKKIKGKYPFKETEDYILTVPCLNRKETLDYIFRSYRFRDYLYITDIFPKMFENDSRCFQRFTSREGLLSICGV